MKRSRVNDIMAHADEMIRGFGFQLPPFAYWTPKEFYDNKTTAEHIIDTQCGWDITDFGSGNFDSMGLFLLPSVMADWQICSVVVACAMLKSF